jgi:diguanylate cyclase (GGDEF)-like protein
MKLAPLVAAGARSLFLLPIKLDARLAGAIVLGHRELLAPDDDELRLVQDLGDRVAVALATAARDRELYRRANYDPLTRLPNRTLFLDELGRELARAERQSKQLAVLFVDLDGFSDVNDSLGHAAGDELLVHVAARLRACMRKADLVARLGGDEFTVVLPDLRERRTLTSRHIIALYSPTTSATAGRSSVTSAFAVPSRWRRRGSCSASHGDVPGHGRGGRMHFEDVRPRGSSASPWTASCGTRSTASSSCSTTSRSSTCARTASSAPRR